MKPIKKLSKGEGIEYLVKGDCVGIYDKIWTLYGKGENQLEFVRKPQELIQDKLQDKEFEIESMIISTRNIFYGSDGEIDSYEIIGQREKLNNSHGQKYFHRKYFLEELK